MADQQQRYIIWPPDWKPGVDIHNGVVRLDTQTGKTWVIVGHMMIPPDSHHYKWQVVEDPDLEEQASKPFEWDADVSSNS